MDRKRSQACFFQRGLQGAVAADALGVVTAAPADDAGEPTLAGNTCLYGATGGAVFRIELPIIATTFAEREEHRTYGREGRS